MAVVLNTVGLNLMVAQGWRLHGCSKKVELSGGAPLECKGSDVETDL